MRSFVAHRLAPLAALTPRVRTYSMAPGVDQVVPVAQSMA